jgi:3',5'-cyclic AMP phosphodiesterase CpdA
MRGSLACFLALPFAFACSSSDETETQKQPPVQLTTEVTLQPEHALLTPPDTRSPSNPEERAAMLAEGYGKLIEAPGEAHVVRAPPNETPPAAGPNAKRVLRFAHMPDLQINDDESPTRLVNFDSPGATAGAFRPQDADLCRMANAAVKTLNELHAKDPIGFLLLGGDNADSAQKNEVDWVIGILSGGNVHCDSGDDNDPAPGAVDGKDPFEAPGLAMPWYWVTGNHDVLVQGNLPVTDARDQVVIGESAPGGTRDWSQPGGPVFSGPVIADPARDLLSRGELMTRIAGDQNGHGVGPSQVSSGKAIYTLDVEGTSLRFLVLDTAAETGGSEGVIHQSDIDAVIKPALDQALADGKWVSLASHHATSSLGDGSGLGGAVQADAVLEPAWLDFIGSYPNVVFSFVGHSHQNRVTHRAPPGGGHAFWEVMTSALADFPHQLRIVEIWDQDNGWLMLRATNVDFAVYGDPAAEEGRTLGTLDFVAGWSGDEGPGTLDDRNVELWIQKP